MNRFGLPERAKGIRLCVIRKSGNDEHLNLCQAAYFNDFSALDTVLRQAEIYGKIEKVGDEITGDFWADIMIDQDIWEDVLPMSREAWNALKNKLLKVKIERF